MAILQRDLKRDMIYSEQWFADCYQISRTPVREALLQLRDEGLIEVLPNRGVIVKLITIEDAKNIYHIKTACDSIREAAATGIDFAVLPEMFCSPYLNRCFRAFGEEAGGPAQTALAAELGIYIVGGSIPELADGNVYNTSYVYDRKGNQIAKHRKVHLFDIDVVGGQRYFESDTLTRGDSITTFETEFGIMGLCICFDMRFEELARCMCLRGSKVIFVPAAFNMTTGPAHWDLLFRQRAVDNQCYTLGCAPARDPDGEYVSWANSIVVEPWGSVVAHADVEATILYADLDLARVDAIRQQLPILSARRTDLYEMKEL